MEDVSNTGQSLGGALEIRLVLVKGAHIKHPTSFVN
jgi:hypothetical protein